MPYASDAQRKWAHTASAKKAGFPTAEFDKASKGMHLPAHTGHVSHEKHHHNIVKHHHKPGGSK